MPTITILPEHTHLDCERGETIYQVVLRNGVPLGSSCGGDGICDKCRVTIVQGMENLSEENDAEKRLKREHGFEADERVSCQTKINGDVTITTGYW